MIYNVKIEAQYFSEAFVTIGYYSASSCRKPYFKFSTVQQRRIILNVWLIFAMSDIMIVMLDACNIYIYIYSSWFASSHAQSLV